MRPFKEVRDAIQRYNKSRGISEPVKLDDVLPQSESGHVELTQLSPFKSWKEEEEARPEDDEDFEDDFLDNEASVEDLKEDHGYDESDHDEVAYSNLSWDRFSRPSG